MTTPSVRAQSFCKCVVPAYELAKESLCRDKGQLVIWVRCKRCADAAWFALTPVETA